MIGSSNVWPYLLPIFTLVVGTLLGWLWASLTWRRELGERVAQVQAQVQELRGLREEDIARQDKAWGAMQAEVVEFGRRTDRQISEIVSLLKESMKEVLPLMRATLEQSSKLMTIIQTERNHHK